MKRPVHVTVAAAPYAGHDDCLEAAARDVARERDLDAWQVSASWVGGDEGDREEIEVEWLAEYGE